MLESNDNDCTVYFHSAHLLRKVYLNDNHILEERLLRVTERLNLTDDHVTPRLRMLMSTAFKSLLSGVLLLIIIYFSILDRKFAISIFIFDLHR